MPLVWHCFASLVLKTLCYTKCCNSWYHVQHNTIALFFHFNVLVAMPAALMVSLPIQSISRRKWWTMCLLCLLCHLCPYLLKVSLCFTSKHWNNYRRLFSAKTNLMFSLRFLVDSDNRVEVDSTSYCLRFPVFVFRSSRDFVFCCLQRILCSIFDCQKAENAKESDFCPKCGHIYFLSIKLITI